MAALRTNIVSNYAGQIWMAAMAVAFLPLYIRILGMEAFGLVGLMLSFQSILQLFDFGIGGAANRELSRRAHDPDMAESMLDLVQTSQAVIWLLTLAAALLIWAFSTPMADHWLHLQTMGRDEGSHAIAIMGLAIALLWPSTFYANCLSGLERQPLLNLINVVFATLRYAGVLPILLWVSPSIEAFLWWYAIVGMAQSLTTAAAVWRALPANGHARWHPHELRRNRKFAGGLFVVGLLALGVNQLDRLTLAGLRPLEELGEYTLALSVAAGVGRMVQPMFNAIYPRFNRLVARQDTATLIELYHLGSQCLAAIVSAFAMVLIVFSRDILFLWTGDAALADKIALPMSILVAGTAINGLMNIPYALQLAYGWTRLAATLNAISLILGIPYCLWAVKNFGATGAAGMGLFANLASLIVGIPLMHRKILRNEMTEWYVRDILPPVMASLVVTLALALSTPPLERTPYGAALLALTCAISIIASALAPKATRAILLKWARIGT